MLSQFLGVGIVDEATYRRADDTGKELYHLVLVKHFSLHLCFGLRLPCRLQTMLQGRSKLDNWGEG